MNIIPSNFKVRTGQKVWCDRGMSVVRLNVYWVAECLPMLGKVMRIGTLEHIGEEFAKDLLVT